MILKTFLACVLGLTVNGLLAQENILKVGSITGNLGLQYERSLSDHFSIIGQFGYASIETTLKWNTGDQINDKSDGTGYFFEARYYFSSKKDLMEGWHIGPYYMSMNMKDRIGAGIGDKTKLSSFGLAAGYQWIFRSKVTLGLSFGAGNVNRTGSVFLYQSYWPHGGATLGINF